MNEQVTLTKIKDNSHGHSRVACHFLNLVTRDEQTIGHENHGLNATSMLYHMALMRARQIGGRKFHNKQFGGGIAFELSTRTEEELTQQIINVIK